MKHARSFIAVRRRAMKSLDFDTNLHKYLQRFSIMDYENEKEVIRNFATDHYVYSRNFQVHLGNVLEKVSDNDAMHLVGENLEEERGRYGEEDLDFLEENGVDRNDFNGVSHPILMKRFVTESKADPTYNEGAARAFTDLVIDLTKNGDNCVGCFDYSKFYHLRNKDEECLNFSLVIMNTMAILAEVISGGKTFLTFSLCAAGTEF